MAQSQKLQNLETLLTSIQFEQQENGAASIRGSILGLVPGPITTGDATLTKESMEVIFKIWIAIQAAIGAPIATQMNRKEKKRKLGINCIENDMANGERTEHMHIPRLN